MACFPEKKGKPRRAEGAHDPLQAKALVVGRGDMLLALISCDVAMLRSETVEEVRRRVESSCPALPARHVHLIATHTHSSPESTWLFGNAPDDPWMSTMTEAIAAAVLEAQKTMQPVTAHLGSCDLPLNHNRRVMAPHIKT